MGVTIKLDLQAIRKLENEAKKSAELTMEQLRKDIKDEQTIPFNTGDMQNNQTFVAVEGEDTINGEEVFSVSLVTGSPQARRLYYHPEYKFQQGKNDNAGGEWLEPYINGDKKDFVRDTFIETFKKRTGV